MTEAKCAFHKFHSRKCIFFFFFFCLLCRFFNLGKKNHNECDSEDCESNEQRRRSIRDLCFRSLTNECTHEDVASHSSRRVEHTTQLDELVSRVTTATKDIEHGVYHTVKDCHAKTSNEGTSEIYSKHQTEICLCIELSTKPLDCDTHHTDNKTAKGCFLVTIL